MGKNLINIALFGLGRIGQMHAENLINHPEFNLKYIFDIDEKLSNKLSKKYKCINIKSPNVAFKDKNIKSIFIATSTKTHLKFIEEGVKNKKIVFCEKPLDLDLKKINQSKKKLSKLNPKIQIGFNRRYDPAHNSLKDYLSVIIVIVIASAVAYACSDHGLKFNRLPIIFICMSTSFIVHWVAFIPSYIARTEKYYDISGTLAYICVLFVAYYLTTSLSNGILNTRSTLVIILVSIWALRLGSFLFIRVLRAGEDRRFREVKEKFSGFLVWWTISALWVFLTTVNALVAIINNVEYYDDLYLYIGLIIWIAGFSLEVIADEQKRKFRLKSSNKDKFISNGLWSISRHPNYFGEIMLWIGMAIIAYPTLQGWQHLSLVSPVFIYFLLTRISGVNLLENHADKKWGEDESYKEYKRNTPVLIPFLKS